MDQLVLEEHEINLMLRLRQLAREGVTEVTYDLQQQAIVEKVTIVRRVEQMRRPRPSTQQKPAPAPTAGASLSAH